MGCGASSDQRQPTASQLAHQAIATAPLRDVDAALGLFDAGLAGNGNGAPPPTRLCVGVFGLQRAGKSAMLHSLRAHLGALAPLATAPVPLTAPTERLELFVGPMPPAAAAAAAGSSFDAVAAPAELVAVDTPGLPWSVSQRRLYRRILPRLARVVWVVDSTFTMEELQASARELGDLCAEVQRMGSTGSGLAATPPPSPTFHLLCAKHALPSAASIEDLRLAHSSALPPLALMTASAYSCEWDGLRKDAAILSLLGRGGGAGAVGSAWTVEATSSEQRKNNPNPGQLMTPAQIQISAR